MLSFLSLLFLPCLIYAHSWLECSKYGNPSVDPPLDGKSYDINKCQGFPRGFSIFGPKASHTFGIDRGFNVQPGTSFCNNRPQNGYNTDYFMAQYTVGEKVRLVWPAKNHDAEVCTNPFIPDTAMKIYVTRQSNGVNGPGSLGTSSTNPNSGWRLVADFKASQIGGKATPEGFQRCPDFCGARGTDKAICFQDMIIPSLTVGQTYTFLWYWIFNQGSPAYTTCWDAQIVSGGGGTPATTTTQGGQPPQTTTTSSSGTTTTQGGGGNAAQQSVRIQIDNTAGVFDETGLKTAISRQLNINECKVVTNTFSGATRNGQSTFVAIFFVNVPTGQVASVIQQIQSPAFRNTISASTGGSNNIATPVSDVAAADSCGNLGTSTSISRFTISLEVSVSTNPGASFSGPLAIGIDDALLRNSPSITADVSCVAAQQAGSFNCAIIVFNVNDVIATSNLALTQTFKDAIAANIPASANNGQPLVAGALTVSNVPTNTAGSGTQAPSGKPGSSSALSSLIAVAVSVAFGIISIL